MAPVNRAAQKRLAADFVKETKQRLESRILDGSSAVEPFEHVLPDADAKSLLLWAAAVCEEEPALTEIRPGDQPGIKRVNVVGDTHGHFLDVLSMFRLMGPPSTKEVYIFNGDFIDRGSWSVELLLLLAAWKILLPSNVYLVRGNHETKYCAEKYGFKAELESKYGVAAKGEDGLFEAALRLFEVLPLAILVQDNTLILHGGLWRSKPQGKYAKFSDVPPSKRKKLAVGTLDELRAAGSTKEGNRRVKGGRDPCEEASLDHMAASDIIWSDPSKVPGIRANKDRNVGLLFGADVFQEFCRKNGIKLLIRSHEGPDARTKRPASDRMDGMDTGFTVDLQAEGCKVVTVFSAPSYPMHTPEGCVPYTNKASVIHLTGPDYAMPVVEEFEAVERPKGAPLYYELDNGSFAKIEQAAAGVTDPPTAQLAAGCAADIPIADDHAAPAKQSSQKVVGSSKAKGSAADAGCKAAGTAAAHRSTRSKAASGADTTEHSSIAEDTLAAQDIQPRASTGNSAAAAAAIAKAAGAAKAAGTARVAGAAGKGMAGASRAVVKAPAGSSKAETVGTGPAAGSRDKSTCTAVADLCTAMAGCKVAATSMPKQRLRKQAIAKLHKALSTDAIAAPSPVSSHTRSSMRKKACNSGS